ncbi:Glutathione transport system permease protein GsiD [bacterium HR16]|nr:Glutathione transport system permease protein GsiD [bacterium HR16]
MWRTWKARLIVLVPLGYLCLMAVLALFAPAIAPYRYDAQDATAVLQPPSAQHLLGTDELGRDVFSRLVYGARVSLTVVLQVELLEVLIGVTLGLLAGYFRDRWDALIMRFTDMMFAFPDILLAILIVAILGPGLHNVFIALALTGWPGMARVVRSQVLALREREFVEAARAIGLSHFRILWRHVLPNLLPTVLVAATVDSAGIVLAESALSFLGLGAQPPLPSWGRMIDDARQLMRSHPMLLVYPATMLSLTVMALNFLGDGLRDMWDPRRRKV